MACMQIDQMCDAMNRLAVYGDEPKTKPVTFGYISDWITMNDFRAVQEIMRLVEKTNFSSETSHVVRSMMEFIMPNVDGVKSDINFTLNRRRLRALIGVVLNIQAAPDESLIVGQEGVRAFGFLVQYVRHAMEAVAEDRDLNERVEDMYEETDFKHSPRHHLEVNLGLCRTPSLDRVLGPSKRPDQLRLDPFVRTLRLFAILFEVNENWGVLFCSLSKGPLIDRKYFISKAMEEYFAFKMFESRHAYDDGEASLFELIAQYLFLFSFKTRSTLHDLLRQRFRQCMTTYELPITVPKSKVLRYVADNLDLFECGHFQWTFNFIGEKDRNSRVSTEEFYQRFSDDYRMVDRDIWIDDEHSHLLQLFPCPKSYINVRSEPSLTAIGRVMAKAILSGNRLDLKMSSSCYKCMFTPCPNGQHLTLVDFKDVLPSSFDFLARLVDSLRRKWSAENNPTLTPLKRTIIMSGIRCGVHSFDDLKINFTVPGFPDVELIPGGKHMLLGIDNAHEYLQLLVWHLLNEGPRESMNNLQEAFEFVMPVHLMRMFYPDEVGSLLSRSFV